MPSEATTLFPREAAQLKQLGERLRLARLRRKLSSTVAAARVGVSRTTLYRAENGDPNVSLGNYFRYLGVLHLDGDLDLLARDDHVGRRLQDLKLPKKRKRVIKPAAKSAAKSGGRSNARRPA